MHTISRGRRLFAAASRRGLAGACAALAAASVLVGGAGAAAAQNSDEVSPSVIGLQELPITGLVGPTGVAVGPNKTVYVADQDGNQVVQYNPRSGQTVLRTGIDAYDIEYSAGRIFVSDTAGDAVWMMDRRGNWTKLFDVAGPLGLFVRGSTVYVAAGAAAGGGILDGGNKVFSFNYRKAGSPLVDITWTTTSSLRDVLWLNGNLYVSDDITNSVFGLDRKGNVSEFFPGERGTDNSVTGMAAYNRQIFLADPWLNTVYVVDKNFRSTTLPVSNTLDAWDVAVRRGAGVFGAVYIADRGNNRVMMFERR